MTSSAAQSTNILQTEMEMPLISPQTYDLIVLGTGLEESMVASIIAQQGHKVLQLSFESSYGSEWSSLSWKQFKEKWHKVHDVEVPSSTECSTIWEHECMSDMQHMFTIDLAPHVVYSRGLLLDQLLGCAAHHYLDFQLLEASLIQYNGSLRPVPGSRAQVFQDTHLSLKDKNRLMKFIKACEQAVKNEQEVKEQFDDRPFKDVVAQYKLDQHLSDCVECAVALDRSVAWPNEHSHCMTAKQGLGRIAKYSASVGQFGGPNGLPFIVNMYGCADICQAFCRSAAVKGTLQALNTKIEGIINIQDRSDLIGVKCCNGQILSCKGIVCNVHYANLSVLQISSEQLASTQEKYKQNDKFSEQKEVEQKSSQQEEKSSAQNMDSPEVINDQPQSSDDKHGSVANQQTVTDSDIQTDDEKIRNTIVGYCVCIVKGQFVNNAGSAMIVFPPSQLAGLSCFVSVLQVGSSLAVAPQGHSILYLQTESLSKKDCIDSLLVVAEHIVTLDNAQNQSNTQQSASPTVTTCWQQQWSECPGDSQVNNAIGKDFLIRLATKSTGSSSQTAGDDAAHDNNTREGSESDCTAGQTKPSLFAFAIWTSDFTTHQQQTIEQVQQSKIWRTVANDGNVDYDDSVRRSRLIARQFGFVSGLTKQSDASQIARKESCDSEEEVIEAMQAALDAQQQP